VPRFIQVLACAAVSRRLRGLLVFDASPDQLRALAGILAAMLREVTGRAPRRVTLGAAESEDALWGTWLPSVTGGQPLFWEPGLLAPSEHGAKLVLIPELPRLGLAAARACVTLVGAEVAHLARSGQHRTWQPDPCWIAGCSRSELGRVSPHLLDRFGLRLDGSSLELGDRQEALRQFLQQPEPEEGALADLSGWGLPPGALREASQRQVDLSTKALRALVDLPDLRSGHPGLRRELTVARVALALARLDAAPKASVEHVERAATLLGLALQTEKPAPLPEKPPAPTPPPGAKVPEREEEESISPQGAIGWTRPPSMPPPAPVQATGPVLPPASSEPLREPLALALAAPPADPYPEDKAPIQREPAALRPPVQQRALGRVLRGPIIGVQPARELSDLALTSTLFEAAKFQAFRQSGRRRYRGSLVRARGLWLQTTGIPTRRERLILRASDLRSYRRAAPPDEMLVLVLDHTSLRGWNWGAAVLPHLKNAYTRRAAICVIQVGAADAPAGNELRARRVIGRSILARQVNLALAAEPGLATPLAHGLDLAFETLQHGLQRGRSRLTRAWLVVVTDGRGNVPLESSREGRITGPVGATGIQSALEVARRIAGLTHVESTLIHSSPRQYPELPGALAEALGATLRGLKTEEEP
jgi:magnesium chelatase subunit D